MVAAPIGCIALPSRWGLFRFLLVFPPVRLVKMA